MKIDTKIVERTINNMSDFTKNYSKGKYNLFLKMSDVWRLQRLFQDVYDCYDKMDNATASIDIWNAEGSERTHRLAIGWHQPHKKHDKRVVELRIEPVYNN